MNRSGQVRPGWNLSPFGSSVRCHRRYETATCRLGFVGSREMGTCPPGLLLRLSRRPGAACNWIDARSHSPSENSAAARVGQAMEGMATIRVAPWTGRGTRARALRDRFAILRVEYLDALCQGADDIRSCCRRSSVVEHSFRKAGVVGSNPTVGCPGHPCHHGAGTCRFGFPVRASVATSITNH